MKDYEETARIFKAFCEPVRLGIIDLLSCKEFCACELLECLQISQPTLSHHMKILLSSNIVKGRKEGTWMYYSIDQEEIKNLHSKIEEISQKKKKYRYCRQGIHTESSKLSGRR